MVIVKSHKEFVKRLIEAKAGLVLAGLKPYYLVIHPARRLVSENVLHRDSMAWEELPKWEAKIFNMEIVKDIDIKATLAVIMTKRRRPLFALSFPFHKDEIKLGDC